MKYYRLWALALFLKAAGSAWDASYHFKYLFEEYSLPHLLNTSGFLLGAGLLLHAFRTGAFLDRMSRQIVCSGYLLFLVAIPLDFAYHLTFGIDLTTWSPTHFIYYIATGCIIFGVHRGYTRYTGAMRPSWRSLHSVFAAFWVEDVLFPCLQQEQGTVALQDFLHQRSVASPEILALVHNPNAQMLGGLPEWLYPLYTSVGLLLIGWLIWQSFGDLRIFSAGTSLYLLFRLAAFGLFASVQYPTSFVPWMVLAIPLCLQLLRRTPYVAAVMAATVYFGCLYMVGHTGLQVAPPLAAWMIVPVWGGALLATSVVSGIKLSVFASRGGSASV